MRKAWSDLRRLLAEYQEHSLSSARGDLLVSAYKYESMCYRLSISKDDLDSSGLVAALDTWVEPMVRRNQAERCKNHSPASNIALRPAI